MGSAGVPNGGGLVKLRSSGAKRQWRLFSTDRIGDETSPVFLVTTQVCARTPKLAEKYEEEKTS